MSDEEVNAISVEKPSLKDDLRDVYKSLDKLSHNATGKIIGPTATKASDLLKRLKGKILTRGPKSE